MVVVCMVAMLDERLVDERWGNVLWHARCHFAPWWVV